MSSSVPRMDYALHGVGSEHRRPAGLEKLGFAHGIVMVIAFGIMFPMGAAFLRYFGLKHIAWIHGIIQLTAFACAAAGFGIGLYVSKHGGYGLFKSMNGHKIIGLVALIIMFLMPFLGAYHHHVFKKTHHATWYGYAHRFIGRATLTMGAINIGLGLQLGREKSSITVAYSLVTATCFAVYFAITIWKGPEMSKSWSGRIRGELDITRERPMEEGSLRTVETTKTAENGIPRKEFESRG